MQDFDTKRHEWGLRARDSHAASAQALRRMFRRLATNDTDQVGTFARVLASKHSSSVHMNDLFDTRKVDVEISDDMIMSLDALRWGRADQYKLVPDCQRRIVHLCVNRGLSVPIQE